MATFPGDRPLHIRHLVCTDAFAGVERYLTYVAVELAGRGHRVEVVGGDPERMRPVLEEAGVDHVAARTLGEVARANARSSRPDAVHSHMTAADAAAVLSRPLVRRPVVSTLHFAHRRGHSALTRAAYRAIRPALSAELAISRYVAEAAGAGVEVLVNGIPDRGVGRPVESRDPVVLVAQRLESEKDSATAVRAWAASGLAGAGWELHVAGKGAERESLAGLAAELGVADSVRFLGLVDDVHERLVKASLFLAPARAEPFGLAVVEAMAAGLPVIAADGGAHGETVGAATPGTLFTPGDHAAAAVLLRDLAADPARRSDLGRRGRDHFLAELTVGRHVDRLIEVYRRFTS